MSQKKIRKVVSYDITKSFEPPLFYRPERKDWMAGRPFREEKLSTRLDFPFGLCKKLYNKYIEGWLMIDYQWKGLVQNGRS
jgi:hypothetical protein